MLVWFESRLLSVRNYILMFDPFQSDVSFYVVSYLPADHISDLHDDKYIPMNFTVCW